MEERDLTGVFNDVNSHFLDYLKSQGITPNSAGFISCLNPNHPDRNPSMHIISEGEGKDRIAHCFSCLTDYNIFHAANVLEGKPLTGVGFFDDTLVHLTKMFNIPYEPMEISPDVKLKHQRRRAVMDAVNVIHTMSYKNGTLNTDHPAIKHLLDRGITEATMRKFKVGCISGFREYMSAMKVKGWTDEEFLRGSDLANKKLFHKNGIIMPIFNHKNQSVGFVTRRTDMAENEHGQYKYINSLNSNIYCKGEVLYNFNNYSKENGPLYIVEGYLDAMYLTQCGLKNVVAIGATILTDAHVNMLMDESVKNIILCLDADAGGNKGTKIALERLSVYPAFKIRVMELQENTDPDTYVREFGLDKFKELAHPDTALSPFAWMIKHTTFEDDPMVVAEQAIPTIAAEESNITRLKMIKELARLTGIAEADIRKDVDSLVNRESSQFIEELKDINGYVQVMLGRRKVKDTKSILSDAVNKIKNLEKKFNNNVDNITDFDNKLEDIKEKIFHGEFSRGLMCPKFKKFYDMFDGLPHNTCLTLIGGRPSAGKTTWLSALGVDLVEANEDLAVFYMSIDDTTELMTLKLLAQRSGVATAQIKKFASLPAEKQEKVREAISWFEKLKERFILIDATAGKTVEVLEAHVEWFTKQFPNHRRIFLLDNFHKLKRPARGGKKTEEISDMSEKIKEITQLYDLHLITTIELRKLDGTRSRPKVDDLKDSVQMEYDADVIAMVHNDYQVKMDETNVVWMGNADGELKPMPYLEVYLYKNKMTGKIGPLSYKLNSHNLQIEEAPFGEIRSLIRQKTNDVVRH